MDERTMDEKIYDTALRSERRTIGHRMSRKVLVVAPTFSYAQHWAHQHAIAPDDVIWVGLGNWVHKLHGMRGVEHVILGWHEFPAMERKAIKARLTDIEAVPFEGEAVDELCSTDPVWA